MIYSQPNKNVLRKKRNCIYSWWFRSKFHWNALLLYYWNIVQIIFLNHYNLAIYCKYSLYLILVAVIKCTTYFSKYRLIPNLLFWIIIYPLFVFQVKLLTYVTIGRSGHKYKDETCALQNVNCNCFTNFSLNKTNNLIIVLCVLWEISSPS